VSPSTVNPATLLITETSTSNVLTDSVRTEYAKGPQGPTRRQSH
jgi:hypothetical protein